LEVGLIVQVYRDSFEDCTAGGVSARCDALTVVNIGGPSAPAPDRPAALLVSGYRDTKHVVPAVQDRHGGWVPLSVPGRAGPMHGGNFAATSDSRWSSALGFHGAAPIHDRYELGQDPVPTPIT
jgi:hypothetical protein